MRPALWGRMLALLALWLAVANVASAQAGGLSNEALLFRMVEGEGLQIATIAQASATRTVDYSPADPNRPTRTDYHGLLRLVPQGGGEGVYSFSPFFEGYTAEDPDDNKNFVTQAQWSPDGRQIAFIVYQPLIQDVAHGVWFWQPARELSTDPSYHVLRQCPSACDLADNPERIQWRARNVAWANDNRSLLINVDIITENRPALVVRYADRDPQNAQSILGARPLRYDVGYWTTDGQIVVSGNNPDGISGFGLIAPDGTVNSFMPASTLNVGWIQDAVLAPDGLFYMLMHPVEKNSPLQLINSEGKMLTAPIGESAPSEVRWNDERTALYMRVGNASYIVDIDGTVTDVTAYLTGTGGVRAVAWVSAFPNTAQRQPTPEPLPALEIDQTTLLTPALATLQIGQILRVTSETLTVYAEPVGDSAVYGALNVGDELVITSEPVQSGGFTWYRVQAIAYGGWINRTDNLQNAE